MDDISGSFEFPVNRRIVGELTYNLETDEVCLPIDGQLVSVRSLAKSLESLEGFQFAIEVIDTSG